MRRETRKHEKTESNTKNILYIGGSILGIGIIAFIITFVVYGNKMEEQSDISAGKIAELVQQAEIQSQTASSQMGKSVEESKNEIANTVENMVENKINTNSTSKNNTTSDTNTTKTNNTSASNTVTTNTTAKEDTTNTVNSKEKANESKTTTEVKFTKPVEGEVSKQYAKDNLVYSATLEEWTTHLGIDIKADKTTVVKAAADGKIKSIKNDPRYGLSIIIEHQNGYETLYSNLLTSEFVEVGEEVKQGQSIGTVGNTATFEILDEPHLHFEITKDGECLDPNEYIK